MNECGYSVVQEYSQPFEFVHILSCYKLFNVLYMKATHKVAHVSKLFNLQSFYNSSERNQRSLHTAVCPFYSHAPKCNLVEPIAFRGHLIWNCTPNMSLIITCPVKA